MSASDNDENPTPDKVSGNRGGLDRRDFLKGGGAVAGGVAAAGMAGTASAEDVR
ncbi:twin-arginine translocation signal domain-containing protein [Acuticoccus sp. MNP-M23]|uniref:twin-arginine translocation signal domain-containing protein n=1 Tax=Acuticoccus sp. MNP-M23 TaxID=3072793 RepID=UPI0035BF252F